VFHAVQERILKGERGYVPIVRVKIKEILSAEVQKRGEAERNSEPRTLPGGTQVQNLGWVRFVVIDNGTGVPEAIRAIIFQLFFTTKPTGQGTGLGLSLIYDIMTKGHGGMLTLSPTSESRIRFVVTLPV
jgi:two-component system NtrC family sensor kinase